MKYILYALLIYALYQFIFNLVIPVYQTTRKIKKGFRAMHTHMQEQSSGSTQDKQQAYSTQPQPSKSGGKKEDYIDFEEVK